MKTVAMPRPACLTLEERHLTLYVPKPHDVGQLVAISDNFDRCVEALGSEYEYTGTILLGDTLVRNDSIGLPNCSTLVATLEWRDGGEERPFTDQHVRDIGKQLNVEYPAWGTAKTRMLYDLETGLRSAIVVTIEGDEGTPNFIMLPTHGRMPYSTVAGIDNVELYPGKDADTVHFVVPEAPRHKLKMKDVNCLVAAVAQHLDIFLTEAPSLIDIKPPVTS